MSLAVPIQLGQRSGRPEFVIYYGCLGTLHSGRIYRLLDFSPLRILFAIPADTDRTDS